MKEKIKGILAGLAYRIIVILTLGQISPLLGSGIIIEQDGKFLFIDRSDGLGYTIPGGVVRHKETVEQCVLRETREERLLCIASRLTLDTDPPWFDAVEPLYDSPQFQIWRIG